MIIYDSNCISIQTENEHINEDEITKIFKEGLERYDFKNKKVITIIPDTTRSGPYHRLVRLLLKVLKSKVKKIDFLIALGTHPIMSEEQINKFLKITEEDKNGLFKDVNIFNHRWDLKETFTTIGKFSEEEISEITGGLFKEEVVITINKLIFNYDIIIILGPVFPHEVVGFSGGSKYFFPGISGGEFLNFFHWLGAVLTNLKINGVIDTPVRQLIDKATKFIDRPKVLIALDIHSNNVKGIFIGDIHTCWRKAAIAASKSHIIYKERQYKKVLGIAPKFYDDLWTAGKVMYKLEPIVEDGGELIIYAPHITEISYTHGHYLKKIGYHTRDYFLKQMDKFKDIPRAILAHSTHVRGIGTFENGVEKPRITVTLATSIPEEVCKSVNLGYKDFKTININDWENREDEGIIVIHEAGEILYRYKKPVV